MTDKKKKERENKRKIAFFAFREERMCFMHLLLNTLDLDEKGHQVKIIVEGKAVKILTSLEEENNPLYHKAKEKGLIDGICRACSQQMDVLEANKKLDLAILSDLQGHPAMADYISRGYEIITL